MVYENRYRYSVAGREFTGASYAKGQCVSGGTVTVEYLLEQPAISRISGMRRRPLSPWAMLVAVLPAVGGILAIAGLVRGQRRVRLLREGWPAEGRLTGMAPTSMRVNNRVVYRMTFAYQAQNGAAGRAIARTHEPERFENGPRPLVLHDPADLENAQVLVSFPGAITIDEQGQPAARGSFAFLLVPALTILGNAWYAYRHWTAGS